LPPHPLSRARALTRACSGLLCSGDKREGERIARLLASRAGVVAASVTYRVSADSASPLRHPQHLADVARALRWLAVVGAADYAIDPLRTVLIGIAARGSQWRGMYVVADARRAGHSVGAWLAALIALTPARANLDDVPLRVVGVVGVQSLFDLR
jgi:acetyl esterase/lipase